MYLVREADHMIIEFMLADDVFVAEKILQYFGSYSMLRRHPTPSPNMFEPLLRTAEAVGIAVDTSSSKNLADSLDRAMAVGVAVDTSSSKNLAGSLDQAVGPDPCFNKLIRIPTTRPQGPLWSPDPYFNKLIRILTTRCMTQAVYFLSGKLAPVEYHHYGQAAFKCGVFPQRPARPCREPPLRARILHIRAL
ncbi:unnamed protein product [Closterium sp. Naga37s-1]|nr:unnamed protein product [Closterium sp. Naga37s-1]